MNFEEIPWSLQMREGLPRRAMKRRRVAINASVVKYETDSKCIALTESDTNMQACALTMIGLRGDPFFI